MKFTAKIVAFAFLGGFIGTALRYLINTIPGAGFTAIWLVNILGAIAIAFFLEFKWFASENRRAFFVTGMAGGFTTMSGITMLLLYAPLQMLLQVVLGVVAYLIAVWSIRKVRSRA